jgi:hypothetical protein
VRLALPAARPDCTLRTCRRKQRRDRAQPGRGQVAAGTRAGVADTAELVMPAGRPRRLSPPAKEPGTPPLNESWGLDSQALEGGAGHAPGHRAAVAETVPAWLPPAGGVLRDLGSWRLARVRLWGSSPSAGRLRATRSRCSSRPGPAAVPGRRTCRFAVRGVAAASWTLMWSSSIPAAPPRLCRSPRFPTVGRRRAGWSRWLHPAANLRHQLRDGLAEFVQPCPRVRSACALRAVPGE